MGKLTRRLAAVVAWLDARAGLTAGQQGMVLVVVALVLFCRCPSLLVHAQFYAEDGKVWYQEAYNGGWLRSLTLPEAGYLNTLQRLGAGVALLAPFRWAPLTMMLFGLLLQCLPVTALLSARCRGWGKLSTRALLAVLYVVSPNAREIHIVLTNCQWHLALVAVLLGLSSVPRGWPGRAVDLVVFGLVSVSGPFGLLMLPLELVFWWVRRKAWTLVQTGLLAVGGAVQVGLLLHDSYRNMGPMGPSVRWLVRIFGGDVVGAGILGSWSVGRRAPMALSVVAALGGVVLFVYVLRYARLEMRLFVLFGLGMLAAALKSPLVGPTESAWHVLAWTRDSRYWFYPMMAFLWGLVWAAREAPAAWLRRMSQWTLVLCLVGVVSEGEYRPFEDRDFAASVERMRSAEPGTVVTMPILPGGDWTMTLVKKR
jgi:hypothetical protein